MKILAIIPARGGSKGIPKKNIINLKGKPLIQYTIEAAKKSQYIDKIVLSSDSDEIINVVAKLGIESDYKRPDNLANDTATANDAVFDLLTWLESNENYVPEAILLLQPTSPLRTTEDVDLSIKQFIESKKDCLVSVHEMVEHPYECVTNIDSDDWQYLSKPKDKVTRRQDYHDKYYYINGAIYLVNTFFFKQEKTFIKDNHTAFYIMPHERGVDIDEYSDLKKAEFYIQSLS